MYVCQVTAFVSYTHLLTDAFASCLLKFPPHNTELSTPTLNFSTLRKQITAKGRDGVPTLLVSETEFDTVHCVLSPKPVTNSQP